MVHASHAVRFALLGFLVAATVFLLGSSPLAVEGERAGFLTGTLRRADGQPLPDARFRVVVQDEGGRDVTSSDDVDVTGQYSLRLPATGEHRVRAFATVRYNGKTYVLEMDPVGDARVPPTVPGEAAVKDFRLRLTGTRTLEQLARVGRATWGQSIDVTIIGEGRLMRPGEAIEITLRPRGPLIDGTPGHEITERIAYDQLGSPGAAVKDVPIGMYIATARLSAPGGAGWPVRLAARWPQREEDLRDELAIEFEPAVGLDSGPVQPLAIWVHPAPPARQIAGAGNALQ